MSTLRLAIEPRDPLLLRDGKPFSAGLSASSLPFPFPSTTAGLLRTICGEGTNFADVAGLRAISQVGPFLVLTEDDGATWQYAFPAPADALAYDPQVSTGRNDGLRVIRLTPEAPKGGMDFADLPLFMAGMSEEKPSSRLPSFWKWRFYQLWLTNTVVDQPTPTDIGPPSLPRQKRMHVAIESSTQTARDGLLFATDSVEFQARENRIDDGPLIRFALASQFDLNAWPDQRLPQLAVLGGEGRIAQLSHEIPELPPPPTEIEAAKRIRLILVTPGAFEVGWRPKWLCTSGGSPPSAPDLRLKLVAAAVPRPLPISGWDLQNGQPKASRLLAAAGSVYCCEVVSGNPSTLWLKSICDDVQDIRDGFGIVTLGVW